MSCRICKHPKHGEMVVRYAQTDSYRTVAEMFGVSAKTLQRHVTQCVYSVMGEFEEREYRKFLEYVFQYLLWEFTPQRKKRPKSIITSDIQFTWSRRAWKKNPK